MKYRLAKVNLLLVVLILSLNLAGCKTTGSDNGSTSEVVSRAYSSQADVSGIPGDVIIPTPIEEMQMEIEDEQ